MKAYFITATGTDIGKTFCTAGLVRARPGVQAVKPLLSGYEPGEASDSSLLLAAMGRPVDEAAIGAITPWRYKAPLSPDMAAARQGQTINYADLLTFCRGALANSPRGLLIEGAGGAAVPLTDEKITADWIKDLAIPALLVSGTYLGSISHCLTSAGFLRHYGVKIEAILLNESLNAPVSVMETKAALARYLPCRILPIKRNATGDEFAALATALDL